MASCTGGGGSPEPSPGIGSIQGSIKAKGDDEAAVTEVVKIAVSGKEVTTATGAYEIGGLAAGEHTVEAKADNYEDFSAKVKVDKGKTTVFHIVLTPVHVEEPVKHGLVKGTIMYDDGSGDPVLEPITVTIGEKVVTADDGTFVIEDIEPGTYSMTAEADGFRNKTMSVDVEGEQTTEVDVLLESILLWEVNFTIAALNQALSRPSANMVMQLHSDDATYKRYRRFNRTTITMDTEDIHAMWRTWFASPSYEYSPIDKLQMRDLTVSDSPRQVTFRARLIGEFEDDYITMVPKSSLWAISEVFFTTL